MARKSKSAQEAAMDRSMLRSARVQVRVRLAEIKQRRRERAAQIRTSCRAARAALRERRAQRLAELKTELAAERVALRDSCQARHAQNEAEAKTERARATKKRAMAVEGYEISRRLSGKGGRGPRGPSKARETREERWDEVRHELHEIDPALLPVWERHKAEIQQRPRRTLTESFLEWVLDHAEEVATMQAQRGDDLGEELAREAQRIDRELAKLPRGAAGLRTLHSRQKSWQKTADGISPAECAWNSLGEHGQFIDDAERRGMLLAIADAIREHNGADAWRGRRDQTTRKRLEKVAVSALNQAARLAAEPDAVPF